MTIFVVQSTGNNVANLPPLLELADPDDPILWVESKRAEDAKWSRGAIAVLQRRGFRTTEAVRAGTQLAELSHSLRMAIRAHLSEEPHSQVCLVGNGGTKLQLMAAWEALNQEVADPDNLELIYGLDRPAVLQRLPSGPTGQVIEQPYAVGAHPSGRAPITLSEVLECRGYETSPTSSAVRVWPGGKPPQVDVPGYGTDPGLTAARHDAFAALVPAVESLPKDLVPPYDRVRDHPRFAVWSTSVFDFLRRVDRTVLESSRSGEVRPAQLQREALNRVLRQVNGQGSALYHATLNLAVAASRPSLGPDQPPPPIGPTFEAAVVGRLVDWLNKEHQPATQAVSEVHLGVIVQSKTAGTVFAELDVLIVLRNGVLLHLECKSHVAPQKDLDARISTLRSASSDLAVLAVVAPLYTAFPDRPWTQTSAQLIERIRRQHGRIDAIPFTLPGQPGSYTDVNGDTHEVASFEEGIERLLGPYVML